MSAPSLPLNELLGSLSIAGAGADTWALIMSEGYDSVEKICGMSPRQIALVGSADKKTIGDSNAVKIHSSLHSERIQKILPNLHLYMEAESAPVEVPQVSVDVKGKNVCFTGTAPISRGDLKALLKAHGANVQSDVSSTTHILFIEDVDSSSGKAKKARQLGTQILHYSTLGL